MPYLFTSESVSEGHPDKVSDAISDGILDAIFTHDPYARVACETFVTTGKEGRPLIVTVIAALGLSHPVVLFS